MARAQGARSQFAAAFELAYGTPPVGGFILLPFVSTTLGSEQGLIPDDLLGVGRDPAQPMRDVVNVMGDVVVPVDLRNFGHWLKLVFGAPVTADLGGGDYGHTFGSGSWVLPSLSAEKALPEVPYFEMISGLRANTMNIRMQRSGAVNATIGCIAQGSAEAVVTGAGVPSEAVLDRFNQFQGALKRNGVALGNVTSAEITYSNNLDQVEAIRSDGKLDGVDPGPATMTGSLDMRFGDTAMMDLATDGMPVELEYSFTISATQKLVLTVHKVYLPKPKVPVSGPGGVQASFAWQGAKGAARMLTAVLTNDVESYA